MLVYINVPPENYFLAFFWSIKTESPKAITPDNWVFPHKHAFFCQMKLLYSNYFEYKYLNILDDIVRLSTLSLDFAFALSLPA